MRDEGDSAKGTEREDGESLLLRKFADGMCGVLQYISVLFFFAIAVALGVMEVVEHLRNFAGK